MDAGELVDDIARDIELVERLLETADGGRPIHFGSYEASTVLAMLEDGSYREHVLNVHSRLTASRVL